MWTYDVARATLSPLTTHPARDRAARSGRPNGQRIIFTSHRAGYPELFWRRADGTGSDERLLARSKDLLNLRADGWSADGKQLLFTEVSSDTQQAIGQIAIERPSDAKMLVKSEFATTARPCLQSEAGWPTSPTYPVNTRSTSSGIRSLEIDSRSRPRGGGRLPLWSRDGRELFFSSPDGRQMFTVAVQSGTTLVAGRPQVLFEFPMLPIAGSSRPYDIAPDGRFMIIGSGQGDASGATASDRGLCRTGSRS